MAARMLFAILGMTAALEAITPSEILIVANRNSHASKSIAAHYMAARHLAAGQLLMIDVDDREEISRDVYNSRIATPIANYLRRQGWVERVLAIVTTSGVPLKISGTPGPNGTAASVDSELAALYADLHGAPHPLAGPRPNPYFRSSTAFRHPNYSIYMVTRLTGFSTGDALSLVDRALAAEHRGVMVFDLKNDDKTDGNYRLTMAARMLPIQGVRLEETAAVAAGIRNVIGYAGWGSNDPDRHDRYLDLKFLPGAIASEYVSTNARTFVEPPAGWTLGSWNQRSSYYAGSPQSLTGDLIRQGVTGASGSVYEPFLYFTPHPQVLFPNYWSGLTLAESFYSALPAVSWMSVIVGDPLCRLR